MAVARRALMDEKAKKPSPRREVREPSGGRKWEFVCAPDRKHVEAIQKLKEWEESSRQSNRVVARLPGA